MSRWNNGMALIYGLIVALFARTAVEWQQTGWERGMTCKTLQVGFKTWANADTVSVHGAHTLPTELLGCPGTRFLTSLAARLHCVEAMSLDQTEFFLANLSSCFWKFPEFSCSTTMGFTVFTVLSQQLLDRLPWNLARTLMFPPPWIAILFVSPWFFPLV